MNITINENNTGIVFNGSIWLQQYLSKLSYTPINSTRQQLSRSSSQSYKRLSYLQIMEICSLCLILIEHTIIFILTFRKRTSKESIFDTK